MTSSKIYSNIGYAVTFYPSDSFQVGMLQEAYSVRLGVYDNCYRKGFFNLILIQKCLIEGSVSYIFQGERMNDFIKKYTLK